MTKQGSIAIHVEFARLNAGGYAFAVAEYQHPDTGEKVLIRGESPEEALALAKLDMLKRGIVRLPEPPKDDGP